MSFKFLARKIVNGQTNFNKWSDIRSERFKKHRLNQIKQLMLVVSGNDESLIFEIYKSFNHTSTIHSNNKYYQALLNIGELYKNNKIERNFKPCVKRKIIKQIRLAQITREESFSLGFKCSKYLWSASVKEYHPKKRGRYPVNDVLVGAIQEHLESCSEIAANRSIKSKFKDTIDSKFDIPVFYRQKTLHEIYESFMYKDQISFSSFCSYIGPEFKKPFNLTDLCDVCEYGKNLKKKIQEIATKEDFVCSSLTEDFDANEFESFIKSLNQHKHESTLTMLNEFTLCQFHKMIADNQRKYFNQIRNDNELLKNSILLVMDFKASLVLGKGPRELSSDYYQRLTRTLLGIGLYYFDENLKRINMINVDLISHNLSTDGISVIRCLRFLRRQEFFKQIEKKHYYVFADTGLHFRCAEVNHYFFIELTKEEITVSLNFFGEQHGKSCRNQHFSVISKYLQIESKSKRIDSTHVIIKCLMESQKKSNNRRIKAGLQPIEFKVLEFLPEDNKRVLDREYLDIPNASCYYHITNIKEDNNWTLKTTILSGYASYINIESLIGINVARPQQKREEGNYHINRDQESIFSSKPFNVNVFETKVRKMKIFLSGEIEADAEFRTDSLTEAPKGCLHSIDNNRPHCPKTTNCSIQRKYTISDLKAKNTAVGQKLLIKELLDHGHAQSRRYREGSSLRQRTTEESRLELIEHYKYFHAQTE